MEPSSNTPNSSLIPDPETVPETEAPSGSRGKKTGMGNYTRSEQEVDSRGGSGVGDGVGLCFRRWSNRKRAKKWIFLEPHF